MKKLICLLALVSLLCAMALPVAAEDPLPMNLSEAFESATAALDTFYELDGEFMASRITQKVYSWEEMEANNYAPKVIPATEVEALLYQYYAPTDGDLTRFREIMGYDAAAGTYAVSPWGGFGGIMSPREFVGYVPEGDTYKIYWQTIDYAFLRDALPEGTNEDAYAESQGYPSTITYGDITYENGPEGYYCILGLLESGKVYTAELNGDVVRLLSAGTFGAGELPVFQNIPASAPVSVDTGSAFPAGATVTVDHDDGNATAAEAMAEIAQEYMVFDFTAKKDGQAIQPSEAITVSFALPDTYSTDVALYYMAQDGKLEQQDVTVDPEARTVTAQLTHFSHYILCDNATKPVPPTTVPPTQAPTQAPTQEPTQAHTTAPAPVVGGAQASPARTILWGAAAVLGVILILAVVITLTKKR